MSNEYTVTLHTLEDVTNLEKEWLSLEARCNGSFFLSWAWIGTWLNTFEPECYVLKVEYDGNVVSLALLTKSKFTALCRFSSTRLHIHQKGNALCDQVWTEYNGFLVESAHETKSILAAMTFLFEHFSDWDELVVGAVTKKSAALLQSASGLERQDLWHSSSYWVDLKKLRASQKDYLDSLSRNTRYQIRRSLKLYQQDDHFRLIHAEDMGTALEYLNEVAPLHLERWGEGISQSGFANEKFVAFHENLIKAAWPNQQIDFIKVVCGERVVGFFYNFIYRGTVYFYLSGLAKEDNPKLKPGLCGHALSVQYYLDSGLDYYDFMGGDDRYKVSLAEPHEELFQIALKKPLFKFKVEAWLRKIKNY